MKGNHAVGEALEDVAGAAAISVELWKGVGEGARKTYHGAQIAAAHMRAWAHQEPNHYPSRYATRAGAETEYREARVPDYHRIEQLTEHGYEQLALPEGRGE